MAKKVGKKKGKKGGGTAGTKKAEVQLLPTFVLPVIPVASPKTQALLFTVASSNTQDLSRMVTHYNYEETLATSDLNGSTALHIAAMRGDAAMIKKLISFGKVPIDALEKPAIGGYSALHHACKEGFDEVTKLLVLAGANPNIKARSSLGETPLQVCCKNGQLSCAALLLKAGANADARDSFGHNASFWATSSRHTDMITSLNLPPVHTATASEHLAIMVAKNPRFALPTPKKSLKDKDKDKKGKK